MTIRSKRRKAEIAAAKAAARLSQTTAETTGNRSLSGSMPINGEVLNKAPEYTFVGSGKDAALVTRAIREGWNISEATKARLAKRIDEEASKKDLSLADTERLIRLVDKIDRTKMDAVKLRMFAQLNGLEAEEVKKQEAPKGDKFLDALLEKCTTPDQVRMLLSVAQSIG